MQRIEEQRLQINIRKLTLNFRVSKEVLGDDMFSKMNKLNNYKLRGNVFSTKI